MKQRLPRATGEGQNGEPRQGDRRMQSLEGGTRPLLRGKILTKIKSRKATLFFYLFPPLLKLNNQIYLERGHDETNEERA